MNASLLLQTTRNSVEYNRYPAHNHNTMPTFQQTKFTQFIYSNTRSISLETFNVVKLDGITSSFQPQPLHFVYPFIEVVVVVKLLSLSNNSFISTTLFCLKLVLDGVSLGKNMMLFQNLTNFNKWRKFHSFSLEILFIGEHLPFVFCPISKTTTNGFDRYFSWVEDGLSPFGFHVPNKYWSQAVNCDLMQNCSHFV